MREKEIGKKKKKIDHRASEQTGDSPSGGQRIVNKPPSRQEVNWRCRTSCVLYRSVNPTGGGGQSGMGPVPLPGLWLVDRMGHGADKTGGAEALSGSWLASAWHQPPGYGMEGMLSFIFAYSDSYI